ncbi:recombination protein RecR [Candidatus Peregrinibacteria bacterium]|nr:recombination protein RecR [Candidatus Peregrinibacteria bacterium]
MLPPSLKKLIDELSRLPGIGPKTAQRLAVHLLRSPHARIKPLGEALLSLQDGLAFCEECWHVTEESPCSICSDDSRDKTQICVVEEVLDVIAIEKTDKFKGLYHVLHGVLSPIDGVGAEQLKMKELFDRLEQHPEINELVLATNPSLEGEATALYIQKQLADSRVSVSRIARGLPIGADLEYADSVTLGKAMLHRTDY